MGNSSSQLRVGVVGVGHLGREHARIYSNLQACQLTAICDTDRERLSECHKRTKGPKFDDYRALIGQVDAVSIAVPTQHHYEIAKFFLENGIHVLVEKPITYTLEQADELLQIAKAKQIALRVGHVERFNAAFSAVQQMATQIRFLEIHRLGPFTARGTDCGVVLDLMIHDLDVILKLIQKPVESCEAIGVSVLTPYEDIANARIKFEGGAICNVTASRLTLKRQRKIRIFQEDAYISLDYGNQEAEIFRKKGNEITREKMNIKKEEPLRNELEHFVSGVINGTNTNQPDIDARNALALAIDIQNQIRSVPYHAPSV